MEGQGDGDEHGDHTNYLGTGRSHGGQGHPAVALPGATFRGGGIELPESQDIGVLLSPGGYQCEQVRQTAAICPDCGAFARVRPRTLRVWSS